MTKKKRKEDLSMTEAAEKVVIQEGTQPGEVPLYVTLEEVKRLYQYASWLGTMDARIRDRKIASTIVTLVATTLCNEFGYSRHEVAVAMRVWRAELSE